MNKKLSILGVTALIAASIVSVNAFARSDASPDKLKQLDVLFNEAKNKLEKLPNQTPEEIENTVVEGAKVKNIDLERREVQKELDPENVVEFENQLNSYMYGLMDAITELKDRAVRENNPEYEKQAKSVQSKLEKFEKEKKAFLNKEKSVAELRKELGLPAY